MLADPDKIKKRNGAMAFLFLVVFLVFSPAVFHPFFSLDDNVHLVQNPSVRGLGPDHLRQIFQSTVTKVYVPLSILSFAVEYKFFQYQPFVYHLDNILLHIFVIGLIWIIARRLGLSPKAAALAAFLFGIHPMHAEPVVWVTGRKDVLYAVFYLLAIVSYLEYGRKIQQIPRSKNTLLFLVLAMGCGVLSALAKPMALSLPVILVIIDYFFLRRFSLKSLAEKIPLAFLLVPIIAKTYLLNARVPAVDTGEAPLIWVWTFVFYVRQFFLPIHLFPAYVLPKPVAWTNPEYGISLIIFVGVMVSLWRYRRARWWLFAWAYYLGSIFFLLRFDDMADGQITADRFMYLPSLGFCLWAGHVIMRVLDRQGTTRSGLLWPALGIMGILVLLAAKTSWQVCLWGDKQQLWNYALKHSPRSFLAYNTRGNVWMMQEKYREAVDDFSSAIRWRPDYAEAFNNRGIAHFRAGRFSEALRDYNQALALKPATLPSAYTHRGLVQYHLGRKEAAMADYEEAIRLNPMDANAYNNRGMLYFSEKKYDQALADFDRAILADPYSARAFSNRGNIFFIQKDYTRALKDYDKAVSLDPRYAGAYYNRSLVFKSLNDPARSAEDAGQARRLGFKFPVR